MKLHNEEIRAACAAELRSVLDSYISQEMGAQEALAVMRAMEMDLERALADLDPAWRTRR